MTSFISRSAVRIPRIGPFGVFFPSAATSDWRNGRSQANPFFATIHQSFPLEERSSCVCGRASANRRTSFQEAISKFRSIENEKLPGKLVYWFEILRFARDESNAIAF